VKNKPTRETDLVQTTETYPEESFAALVRLEDGHFWFEERNNLISWAMKKYAQDCRSFLEIGCGTGFVLRRIAEDFPQASMTAVEYYEAALPFARQRCPRATISQADITNLPFESEFDVVGCFDVLEHIPDDLAALRNLKKALKPGGLLLVSVPQHMWLWSEQDEHACHQRRYTRKELATKATSVGLRTVFATSFVSLAVPLMLLRKLRYQKRTRAEGPSLAEFEISPLLNRGMRAVLGLERGLVDLGVSWGLGGSLVMGLRPQ
jgi:2-polyprenyl-3-methyl-5-hydroxy-6-metoxy-1,4-benzoquinol methylase